MAQVVCVGGRERIKDSKSGKKFDAGGAGEAMMGVMLMIKITVLTSRE